MTIKLDALENSMRSQRVLPLEIQADWTGVKNFAGFCSGLFLGGEGWRAL